MNRWFLAVAVGAAGAVGLASADYIVITANVGQAKPGPPPMGPMGVPPAGSSGGMMGVPPASSSGGMMGLPPAGSTGPMGGMIGFSQQGGPAPGQPLWVGAVVEVTASFKDLEKHAVPAADPRMPPILTKDLWGVVRLQNFQGAPLDLHFIPLDQVPTVAKRFEAKYNEAFKDKSGTKPTAEKILEVADYALTHGRNDKFVEVMLKLGEDNANNPAFQAFQKVQANLDRPPARDDSAAWQKRLGDGYKMATLTLKDKDGKETKGHYILFHNLSSSDLDEVQERLARLEDCLQTFYYWFARQGVVLPPPEGRLPALLAAKEPEFHRTRASLTDPPVVADAFFARRENLAVFCARPLDPSYDMLDKASDPLWKQGNFVRQELITGKEYVGYPKATPPASLAGAETLALLMKALEDESERAGVTHDASRQLLFASGLLPRGVAVPEWLQFGMGSFFETPEHSPWPTPAGPNVLYLPVFLQEMGGKKFEGDALKSLHKIVTDGYFRELGPEDARTRSPRLLQARAAAWSLTYYLAKKNLDHLQRYFKLLGDQPRDLELDEGVLWQCFARSFDAYDPKTGKFDEAKLGQIAAAWQSFVGEEHLEAEDLMKVLAKTLSDLKEEGDKPPAP